MMQYPGIKKKERCYPCPLVGNFQSDWKVNHKYSRSYTKVLSWRNTCFLMRAGLYWERPVFQTRVAHFILTTVRWVLFFLFTFFLRINKSRRRWSYLPKVTQAVWPLHSLPQQWPLVGSGRASGWGTKWALDSACKIWIDRGEVGGALRLYLEVELKGEEMGGELMKKIEKTSDFKRCFMIYVKYVTLGS